MPITPSAYTSGTQVIWTDGNGVMRQGPPIKGDIVFNSNNPWSGNLNGGASANWGIDRDGYIWTCVIGGDPGTWVCGGRLASSVASGTSVGGSEMVQGVDASGATATANPVGIGGIQNTTLPTLTNGQRGEMQLDTRGAMLVVVKSPGGVASANVVTPIADGVTSQGGLSTSSQLLGFNGSTWDRIITASAQTDALGASATGQFRVLGYSYGFNGSNWDRLRTPNIFRQGVRATSGNNAFWTPAAGKKFRLMGYFITMTAEAAAASAADMIISLTDAGALIGVSHSVYVPALSPTTSGGGFSTGFVSLGNGILSAVANNALFLNITVTLTAGTVSAVAIGTEE
jgi:hypothetical protein